MVLVMMLLLALSVVPAGASGPSSTGLGWIRSHERYLDGIARRLWEHPEPAHHELATSELLIEELSRAGFSVERGVSGLPTAFVARYGEGAPRLGIVALLDALPGLSQREEATERRPLVPGGPGHGCGHNLIGAADLGAALALRDVLERHALPGTLTVIGAPAEEIYHGGVYMVRDGVFDDLDALLFWHPSSVTTVIGRSGLAMDSVRFVFRGRPSDATDAPHKGRNALAAVERLVQSVSEMSVPQYSVVSHVIEGGGGIPSVILEHAGAWYFLHGPRRGDVERLFGAVAAAARSAATSTGTELEIQVLSRTRHWLIHRGLAELIQQQLSVDEPLRYDDDERKLARALREPFAPVSDEPFFAGVLPLDLGGEPVLISDDTAEAGWVVPRGGFLVACFPAGVPSHTWQWTSSAASSFARKGMLRAARTLVRTGVELLTRPETLQAIREEFERITEGAPYRSPLPFGQGPFRYLERPERRAPDPPK